MNAQAPLESSEDINRIARNLLIASKAWGKFPTPVEQITQYAELQVQKGVDLSKVDPGFFTTKFEFIKSALSKVLGMVDLREKVIYLDQTQKEPRRRFIELHEVGHKACVWQGAINGYLDDDESLDPEVEEIFEREASFFASGALFQIERFDEEALKLPLCIKSPQALAQKFGSSNHAAIRRYVERSTKRCAVLILHKPEEGTEYRVKIRDYFQSPSFTAAFGGILWPRGECGLDMVFVQEIKRGRKWHQDGVIALIIPSGESVTFTYHFFKTPYNTFILLTPTGEKIHSRTTII